ncbi:activator of basal transcription 1 [Garra rufa]|uniref:activator of basal transcription 1 n=1 Tax=Garra rufa TaxID=137080 RepID=UPI003CCE5BA4
MALLEKNEVTADLETQPLVNEEESNDSKQEEDEKQQQQEEEDNADGVKDADQEMKLEDDNDDDKALDLYMNKDDDPKKPKGKKCIPGIVYLGHIPPSLRPRHLRTMLGVYGEIGRIFLQPKDHCVIKKKKKKKAERKLSTYTEGWVEFRDKRIAKRIAASLHNTPMTHKKKSRFVSDLWSIKYLHRFHWCHLNERLVYEQTVYRSRMRTEISQAKKETNFYLASVEKSQRLENLKKKKEKKGEVVEQKTWHYKQRPTEDEIQLKRFKNKSLSKKNLQKAQEKSKNIQEQAQSNVSLLAKIFSSGKS